MRILVVGEISNLNECRQKFGEEHSYLHGRSPVEGNQFFGQSDLVFDFVIDQFRNQLEIYHEVDIPVFFNTAKVRLSDLIGTGPSDRLRVGFAGMITFLNREVLEVCLSHSRDYEKVKEVCVQLKTEFQVVKDRVGLVTPRVICMIINEAYYTAQEGTAARADIDLAMKLGTNYPFGPFEWCEKIGVRDVYELLLRVYEDSKNERYKICPQLKKEYLLAIT